VGPLGKPQEHQQVDALRVGFGRIVVSEIEVPNMLVNQVLAPRNPYFLRMRSGNSSFRTAVRNVRNTVCSLLSFIIFIPRCRIQSYRRYWGGST
jgi:hypothetical protein